MTVIRKRTGDKGGCCSPYSELQLEIERVDQTAIDAKTTANNAEAMVNANIGKLNEAIAVVPQVQTNTEAIAAHAAELMDHDAKINANTIVNDQQNTDIAALKTKTNDNTAAIEALENEVGPETVAGTIQYRLKDIDTKLPTAIKEVEMTANASTVTHKATHISGTAESDAMPVVSREQAGIMSASVYAAMEDVIANNTSRISVLEQSAPTFDISGLVGPNPTNAEISAAFQQKYPTVPIQAGLRAADYDNAHFWQYGKNTWILLTQIDVQKATNQSLGIVKGSGTDGKIFVETDGSMSLKGYDALVSKDATHDSKISTLETGIGDANARIDAMNTEIANNAQDIVTANGNISANANDINGLKGRMATAEGQIATHETKINQHTQSINGLTTDVNGLKTDVNGLKTDVNGLKTDVNGLSTDVNALKQKDETLEGRINNLSSDVNNIKTGKQDKLIAGDGISIGSDGKTISTLDEWKIHSTLDMNDILTIEGSDTSTVANVKKDLKFCYYGFVGPGNQDATKTNKPWHYEEFNLPRGRYLIGTSDEIFMLKNNSSPYSYSYTPDLVSCALKKGGNYLTLQCHAITEHADGYSEVYLNANDQGLPHRLLHELTTWSMSNLLTELGFAPGDTPLFLLGFLIKYKS